MSNSMGHAFGATLYASNRTLTREGLRRITSWNQHFFYLPLHDYQKRGSIGAPSFKVGFIGSSSDESKQKTQTAL
jgi:hypothetical protein